MEKPSSQRLTGADQEGGGAQEDGEKDEGGGSGWKQEKKHQDLQRDRGGQVRTDAESSANKLHSTTQTF